jgi:hypothetical protein
MSGEDEEPGEPNCPEGWAFLALHGENARLAARVAELEAQAKQLERERDSAEFALLDSIRREYGSVALWHLHQAMHGLWDDLVMRLHEKASKPWAALTPAPSEPPQ